MANIASQKKRIARTERERVENRHYITRIKTLFKELEEQVADKQTDQAEATHKELVSAIDKGVKAGGLHSNNGARKKSRAARILSNS